MDLERLLTKEKADAIFAKIAKGLEEDKIVGSANMIAYAMKESWFAGFVEGRKYPLQESKCPELDCRETYRDLVFRSKVRRDCE